jgi:hypothetical protein
MAQMPTPKKTTPVAMARELRAVAGARSAQARTLKKKAFLVATVATGGGAGEGTCSLSLTKTKKGDQKLERSGGYESAGSEMNAGVGARGLKLAVGVLFRAGRR